MNLSEIIGIIQAIELPLTILGTWILFKKIMKNKDVQEMLKLMKEGKEQLKKILENQKHEH